MGKRNDRSIIENLMPGLKALSVGSNADVKKALLTQLRPLTQMFTEKFGNEGY